MTPDPSVPEPAEPSALLDDLAAFALDAMDLDEAVTTEALLLTDPAAAALERDLRDAAGSLAEGLHGDGDHGTQQAARALRERVLGAAHAARPPTPVAPAGAVEVHRIELERAVALLRRLRDDDWDRPLDAPEFAGWSVRDLAAHLAANAGLAAQVIGLTEPELPETTDDNDERTAQVIARHRSMSTAETIDELETCARAVDDHVTTLARGGIDDEVRWWGMDVPVTTMLVVRSFETWTHADDIRRAVGLPQLPPPAPSLARMSEVASRWAPQMVASTGHALAGRSVELHLTGPGGGVRHLPLGDVADAVDVRATPDAVITMDIVDYCRAIGDRIPAGGVPYDATGDLAVASAFVSSLNALAML